MWTERRSLKSLSLVALDFPRPDLGYLFLAPPGEELEGDGANCWMRRR